LRALKEIKEEDVSTFFATLGERLRFRSGLKSIVLGVGPDTPGVSRLNGSVEYCKFPDYVCSN